MKDKFIIKDFCRSNLNRYLLKAYSVIPEFEKPLILDMGCGTGVSAMALMEICDGFFYELDSDEKALDWLSEKAKNGKLEKRIRIINFSLNEKIKFDVKFDMILAEGILNVIGFDLGLSLIVDNLKNGGYVIIHDELKDDSEKRNKFIENGLQLLDSFILDDKIWLNEYFEPLEIMLRNSEKMEFFENEIKEIEECKLNPDSIKSVYYILRRK